MAKEMTAVEYLKEKARMTKVTEDDTRGIGCSNCPISAENNGCGLLCSIFELMHPEEAVSIIQKWAEEHPPKTFLSDLLEKYPKVPLSSGGTPYVCVRHLYPNSTCEKGMGNSYCSECWRKPLEV